MDALSQRFPILDGHLSGVLRLTGRNNRQKSIRRCTRDLKLTPLYVRIRSVACCCCRFHLCVSHAKIEWLPVNQKPRCASPNRPAIVRSDDWPRHARQYALREQSAENVVSG